MRRSAIIATVALAAFFVAARAGACPKLTLDSDDPELIALINDGYANRHDIDTCAGVSLVTHGRQITVTVTLPDGRKTRRTTTRAELLTTLEALLRVPAPAPALAAPAEEPARMTAAPALEREPATPAAGRLARSSEEPPRDAVVLPQSPRRPRIALEIGAASGVRVGTFTAVGVGGLVLADIDSGLVGIAARHDRYREESDEYATSADLIGGKRFRLGASFSLDLVAGIGVKMETARDQSGPTRTEGPHFAQSGAVFVPPPPLMHVDTHSMPEAVVELRWSARAQSLLRVFVSLDAAASESWSLGLSLGAAVGT